MAEFSAQLDQHSALHKQTQAQIRQLANAVARQSDDIVFLLKGQAEHNERLEQIQAEQGQMRAEQTRQGDILNTILSILQGRSNN